MAGEARALPFRQRLGLDRCIRAVGHHVMGAVLFDHPRRAGLRMGSHRGLPVGLLRRAWPGPADGLQGGEIGGMGHRRHSNRPDALPAQQRQARALAMHCSNSAPGHPRAPIRSALRNPRRTGAASPGAGGAGPQADQAQHRQPRCLRLPCARAPAARDRRRHGPHRPVHPPAGPAGRTRSYRWLLRPPWRARCAPGPRLPRQWRQRTDRPLAARPAQPGRRSAGALARLPAVVGLDHPQRWPPGVLPLRAGERLPAGPERDRDAGLFAHPRHRADQPEQSQRRQLSA
ncbi:hypothetical protein G6F50_013873 [Rhizopus delemar]|uniref:Uncharacterized protein n=1 Tax=Rhizopus delemar TaxID=936053 RepID=A0A9P6YBS8_9FUNG|nr:hypothetical protein G6F50_013873 [Rhizopus delemar]